MELKEIIDKFNLPIRLNPTLSNRDFKGDFKKHTFENNVHTFSDVEEEHILKVDLENPNIFVDYFWSDGDGHLHRYAYDEQGEISLMS